MKIPTLSKDINAKSIPAEEKIAEIKIANLVKNRNIFFHNFIQFAIFSFAIHENISAIGNLQIRHNQGSKPDNIFSIF